MIFRAKEGLTPSQLSAIAVKTLPFFEQEAKKRQLSVLKKGDEFPVKEIFPQRGQSSKWKQRKDNRNMVIRLRGNQKTLVEIFPQVMADPETRPQKHSV